MNKVQQVIEALIDVEGGYSNNPHDAGGETMWGITEDVARANGYTGAMRDMSKDTARAIYLRKYFVAPGFQLVFSVSPGVAEELFDTGVNMGLSVPGPFLQRCLNVLNKSHADAPYPDLKVDGVIGNATIGALTKFMAVRRGEGELVLLRMLNALQGARYIGITEGRVQNEEFIYGWFLNRVVI